MQPKTEPRIQKTSNSHPITKHSLILSHIIFLWMPQTNILRTKLRFCFRAALCRTVDTISFPSRFAIKRGARNSMLKGQNDREETHCDHWTEAIHSEPTLMPVHRCHPLFHSFPKRLTCTSEQSTHARWDLPSNLAEKSRNQYFCHTLNLTLTSGALMECDKVDMKKDQGQEQKTEISRENQWVTGRK